MKFFLIKNCVCDIFYILQTKIMSINENWYLNLLHNEPALMILLDLLGKMQTFRLLSVCKNIMRRHFLAKKLIVTVRTLDDLNNALALKCKRIHIAEKLVLRAVTVHGNFQL